MDDESVVKSAAFIGIMHSCLPLKVIFRKAILRFLLLLLLSLQAGGILYGQSPVGVEIIGIEQGLSQGYVSCVTQDREGFLWIGTRNGLNRYDGQRFMVFMQNPLNPYAVSGNLIESVCDFGEYILVGTQEKGLELFEKKTRRFYQVLFEGAQNADLMESNFSEILLTPDGQIWCAVRNVKGTSCVVRFTLSDSRQVANTWSISDIRRWDPGVNVLKCLSQTDSKIWIASDENLYAIDKKTGNLNRHCAIPSLNNVTEGKDGDLWFCGRTGVGKLSGGAWTWTTTDFIIRNIYFWEQQNAFLLVNDNRVYRFKPDDFNNKHLRELDARILVSSASGKVNNIFKDKSEVLWFGTNGYGLLKHTPRLQRFKTFLPGNSVNCAILIDGQKAVGAVVNSTDFMDVGASGHVLKTALNKLNSVSRLVVDPFGNHWLLSKLNTQFNPILYRQAAGGRNWEQILVMPGSNNLSGSIEIGPDDKLWFGIGHQLMSYSLLTNKLASFDFSNILPENAKVNSLKQTENGHWWLGTPQGLVQTIPDRDTFRFRLFNSNSSDNYQLLHTNITSLLVDPKQSHILWIGTLGGGVTRLDTRTLNFTHLNTRNGLPNDVIYGILADQAGVLWMSSNKGLIRFDPESNSIRNYTVLDGLPANEFNSNAYARHPDGTLYFGCVKGLVAFNPADFKENPVQPAVRITRLEINNRHVAFGDTSGMLQQSIEFTRQLKLPFSQNSISLQFAALEYSIPSKNRFRYYLKGAEPEWVHNTTEPQANYLNLSPGKYTFLIKGSNSDGVWNDTPTALDITILPPWYRSTLAYFLYAFLVIGLGYGVLRFLLNRQHLKYQLALKQQESERLKELDNFKSKLYTNLTHEFRTPLTVIQGMAAEVSGYETSQPVNRLRQAGNLIQRNGASLLHLVNQLLDLAKLEAKSMTLHLVQADLVAFVKYLAGSFESLAAIKDIHLELHFERDSILMAMDKNQVQAIVSNLLSNAIKFTGANGDIALTLRYSRQWESMLDADHYCVVKPDPADTGDWVALRVRDTGTGIAPELLPHLFDRFYQAPSHEAAGGSGIGLALVRELVQLMQGGLAVRSWQGRGTEFVVLLPVKNTPGMNGLSPKPDLPTNAALDAAPLVSSDTEPVIPREQGGNLPNLLIVEDNPDVLQYILTCVEGQYQVKTASNGQEGIDLALETVPDIILSDVMMPVKDGFEVVNTLKNDERCSHVPIVLLTAKVDLDSRITGLERGADAYLAKPFEKQELLVWLRKLLELRRNLQARYSNWGIAESGAPTTPPDAVLEDAFILKIQSVLEGNLEDENFGVHELCRKLGMSRTQLHNKIKALTGKSTTLYLRYLRLHHARELLQTTDKNVSEVALDVGFRYVQHFSQYYFEEFGEQPSKSR